MRKVVVLKHRPDLFKPGPHVSKKAARPRHPSYPSMAWFILWSTGRADNYFGQWLENAAGATWQLLPVGLGGAQMSLCTGLQHVHILYGLGCLLTGCLNS